MAGDGAGHLACRRAPSSGLGQGELFHARLTADEQDDIARTILHLAGDAEIAPVALTPEERNAVARSKAAAARGEFATGDEVRAVWAKYGR
jgi:hypothetical protein